MNFKSGRISKPKSQRKKSKAKRWVKVKARGKGGDEYLVEDLSPVKRLRPNRRIKYY